MAYVKYGGADRASVPVGTKDSSVASSVASAQTLQSSSASLAAAQQAIASRTPSNVSNGSTYTPGPNARASMADNSGGYSGFHRICGSEPNPLEVYASVNYLFTMACLTPGEFNTASYREIGKRANDKRVQFQQVIFSSAGRFDPQRVDTTHGQPEYFVENFKQVNAIAPNPKIGNAYAMKYEFEIYEPYSMGVFIQSVQQAATLAGYSNHLEAPFCIKLEFKGFDDDGNPLPGVVRPKFFVFKLTEVEFTVSEAGSKYNVTAIPYNHFSYNDSVTLLKSDVSLLIEKNKTVNDVIVKDPEKSLVAALNKNEKNAIDTKRGQTKPLITYKISFPTPDGGADPEGNEISAAKYKYDIKDGGKLNFPYAKDVYDGAGGKVDPGKTLEVETDKRRVHYAQGQNIISIITELVNASEYTYKEVTTKKDKDDGFIQYFKVDVQEKITTFDDILQAWRKVVTFKVRPYKIHGDIYGNPTSNPVGYETIKKLVAREYHYLYTGYNVDVLDFDIKIKYLFYRGVNPQSENKNIAYQNQGGEGQVDRTKTGQKLNTGNNIPARRRSVAPQPPEGADMNLTKTQHNGVGVESPENLVAQNFHESFVNGVSADMVRLDLKILGDPYWLADSGPANYTITLPGPTQKMKDDTMNYESSDIFTYVIFKTPTDALPDTGKYEFSDDSYFSGIYRVTKVENLFSEGMFTQKLDGVRVIGQDLDYDKAKPRTGNTPPVMPDKEIPPATSLTDLTGAVP